MHIDRFEMLFNWQNTKVSFWYLYFRGPKNIIVKETLHCTFINVYSPNFYGFWKIVIINVIYWPLELWSPTSSSPLSPNHHLHHNPNIVSLILSPKRLNLTNFRHFKLRLILRKPIQWIKRKLLKSGICNIYDNLRPHPNFNIISIIIPSPPKKIKHNILVSSFKGK